MIHIEEISLLRGGRTLLESASLTIHAGQHIGFTGANGTGKTSLFKVLLGELHVDAGNVRVPGNISIAHMAQEFELADIAAVEHVINGDRQLRKLEQALLAAEDKSAADAIGHIHEKLHTIDGYTAHYRAEQIMHGLGFSHADCQRSALEFSGGWRIRLNLAQVLMCPGDLLLLDEPTNHLDLDATLWLELWLKRFQGTLLLISHDRDVLDNVVDHIVHIEHKKLHLYRGHYTEFEKQRAERLAQQQAMYEKQQARIKEIQSFVNRFRAKATKARQAQSRLKELDRMQEIAAAHVDSPFNFHILESKKISDPLLVMRDASIAYGDNVLLKNISLGLHPGSRVGLLGANGAGKSTLIKAMMADLELYSGERVAGEHLRIGYFTQHQLEALDLNASALLHLQRLNPHATEQRMRNFLGGFNFNGDRALEPVRPFSGGEKARLALAIIAWQQPNLLLLDEPTNHLDLEMRHALTLALQIFKGAMVIVSHDRHLLRNCVDTFWLVAEGGVKEFNGDLKDYQKLITAPDNVMRDDNTPRQAPKITSKQQRQQDAIKRQSLTPVKNKLKHTERELEKYQVALQKIETQLLDSELYQGNKKEDLPGLLKEQGTLKSRLNALEISWLELQEELEAGM
jgi:ATP-binding cassette subfamily F protein 3